MSVGHPAELLRHAADLAQEPRRWMPWNYRAALVEAGVAA